MHASSPSAQRTCSTAECDCGQRRSVPGTTSALVMVPRPSSPGKSSESPSPSDMPWSDFGNSAHRGGDRTDQPTAMRRSLTSPLLGVPCATRRQLSNSAAASLATRLNGDLASMREAGTFKVERVITSPMEPEMRVAESEDAVLNFCANNYLGFSNHPRLVEAAGRYLKRCIQTTGSVSAIADPLTARLPTAALPPLAATVWVCRRFASSAARRTSTSNSRPPSAPSTAQTIPSCFRKPGTYTRSNPIRNHPVSVSLAPIPVQIVDAQATPSCFRMPDTHIP
eukprot:scaffold35437_cov101-Isochrysis_galbana.AAC.1